jgi:hypothetical protein
MHWVLFRGAGLATPVHGLRTAVRPAHRAAEVVTFTSAAQASRMSDGQRIYNRCPPSLSRPVRKPFQIDGLKGMLQSALDSGMTQVAISPVALSELS